MFRVNGTFQGKRVSPSSDITFNAIAYFDIIFIVYDFLKKKISR